MDYRPEPRLFALLIGVDKYDDPMTSNLRGAVHDARRMENYLNKKLGVPKTHITILLDEHATRAGILRGFLDLTDNTNRQVKIRNGDAILIFFAGHGSLVAPPPGWSSERLDGKIQSIVPQDFHPAGVNAIDVIPDRTIGALLDEISIAHGNNITIILDCCHSGSGTRGSVYHTTGVERFYRTTDVGSYRLPPNIDRKILSRQENSGIGSRIGQESHILLAACSENEGAREDSSRGEFTTALLNVLNRVSPDQITYAELLGSLDPIPGQNPQLEGVHRNRMLFNSKAPHIHRICHPIRQDFTPGLYILDAGNVHGICEGAEFTVYRSVAAIFKEAHLGVLLVKELEEFRSVLVPTDSRFSPTFDGSAVAIQTKAGDGEEFKIHIDTSLVRILLPFQHLQAMMGCGRNPHKLAFVSDRLAADLEVVQDGDKLALNIIDRVATTAGLHQLSGRINLPITEEVLPFLNTAGRYYHLLKKPTNPGTSLDVIIEFRQLQLPRNPPGRPQGRSRIPVGDNLIKDGRIELTIQSDLKDEKDRCAYGFQIINSSGLDLYLNVFYFDNSDLSILSYYQSGGATTNAKRDFSLRKGGSVTLGYGPGQRALTYRVPNGQNVDVGFVKFYFSTSALDLSRIPQCSAFGSRSAGFMPEDPVECWNTVLVPIIQRRAKAALPVNDLVVEPSSKVTLVLPLKQGVPEATFPEASDDTEANLLKSCSSLYPPSRQLPIPAPSPDTRLWQSTCCKSYIPRI